jgi:ribosomal protein S18 acetylase RimI-like enzyme
MPLVFRNNCPLSEITAANSCYNALNSVVRSLMDAPEQNLTHFALTLALEIRRVQAADLPKLEWYGQFTHFRGVFQRAYQDQRDGKRLLLVADCANFPIGRLFILWSSRNQRIADGVRRGYLYSFAVLEMLRGQGIGTRLLGAAEQVLLRRRYEWATLAVGKDNPAALRLYERQGYQIFNEDEGRWRYTDHRGNVQQVVEPCWLLEKRLVPR